MTPNAAATLGMVFYELATNAVKYGALAVGNGHLDIAWQVHGTADNACVKLVWIESGGTTVPADIAAGFGVTFIRRTTEYELRGSAEMEPVPGGLRWALEFPMAQNVQHT